MIMGTDDSESDLVCNYYAINQRTDILYVEILHTKPLLELLA